MVEYKKCNGECGLEKELNTDNFYWQNNKNNFTNKCKICLKEYEKKYREKNKEKRSKNRKEYYAQHRDEELEQQKEYRQEHKKEIEEYYQDNKEEILKYKKQYYQNNKVEILENRKEYYIENKEEINEYKKQYYLENKEEILENSKQYRQENKEEIKKYNKEYIKNRLKNDPEYKLHKNISCSIYQVLKNKKGGKSILKHLPYTMEELKKHIEDQFEPWMTWDNWGVYDPKTHEVNRTWQLDHIIAHSKFHYEDMECQKFRDCWALSNLQPLDSKENILKSNR